MLGLSALAAADHSAAAHHLDQAWRTARERGLGGANVVPFGGDLVEAHVRAGDSQRAHEALAWLDERAAATGLAYPAAAAARCHGLLADDLDSAVASSLFVSRKTVEAHLTRIYRKLGVRSRTELARRLVPARTGAADPNG